MKAKILVCALCFWAHSTRVAAMVRPLNKTVPAAIPGALHTVPSGYDPAQFIAARAQRIVTELMSRPLKSNPGPTAAPVQIEAQASKQGWLEAVYQAKLVESSWSTEMLSDKRLLAEVIGRELGEKSARYLPKTLGVREFLARRHLLGDKGEIRASGDQIESALHEEFPMGFLVRPAVGVARGETGRGLYPESDLFINDLLSKGRSDLYSIAHFSHPMKDAVLDSVASGELYVLQENFISAADLKKRLKNHSFQSVRVHTYENRIVENAVPARWVQHPHLSKEQLQKAEAFVAEFLQALPIGILQRQAFGIDVAVMDNGEMRIIELVSNRGKAIGWSSYLDQPRVLASYSRHFETYTAVQFQGLNGSLIRHGFANYLPFWQKRIEKAPPGLSKLTAYLPPVP